MGNSASKPQDNRRSWRRRVFRRKARSGANKSQPYSQSRSLQYQDQARNGPAYGNQVRSLDDSDHRRHGGTRTGADTSRGLVSTPAAANTKPQDRKRRQGSEEEQRQGGRNPKLPRINSPNHRSRSNSPGVPAGSLGNLRILGQHDSDAHHLVDYQPNTGIFRIVAFGLHLGISILESREGRQALVESGLNAWTNGNHGQGWVYTGGNSQTHMLQEVNLFLNKIREDPPNIFVSQCVGGPMGEGVTQRFSWPGMFDHAVTTNDYAPKFAVIYQLSAALIDDALAAAVRAQTGTDPAAMATLERFLCTIGLTCAHELVHCFQGFLAGDSDIATPSGSSWGSNTVPELGRLWEGNWTQAFVESYYDASDPLGVTQAGTLWANKGNSRGFQLAQDWIRATVRFNIAPFAASSSQRTSNLNTKPTMADKRARTRPVQAFSVSDPQVFFDTVNRMPLYQLSRDQLRGIQQIATNPAQHLVGH